MIIHFVACMFSHVSPFYSRGWQCAQQLVLSYTKELRKSQQHFWKEEVWTQETTWCYCILQVGKYLIHTCGFLAQSFKIPGLFATFISVGVDLIAAFYGCLYAGVIPVTVRPPHPQNLAATLPTVRMIIDVSAIKFKSILFWNIWTLKISCLICRWVKQPASSPLSLSWGSSGPGRLLPASTSRPGPLSLIQVPEPLCNLELWGNDPWVVSFYCFSHTFKPSV